MATWLKLEATWEEKWVHSSSLESCAFLKLSWTLLWVVSLAACEFQEHHWLGVCALNNFWVQDSCSRKLWWQWHHHASDMQSQPLFKRWTCIFLFYWDIVDLQCHVVLVSGVQHNGSLMHTRVHMYSFSDPFPCRLLQDIEYMPCAVQ